MCEHEFKPLKIERDGEKVHACQECGALKIGENTIIVDKDYIDLAPLTSDPALAEGRLWFRDDKKRVRWSPDGSKIKYLLPGWDLSDIKGLEKFASGVATDSWYMTVDASEDVWIRQLSTRAAFQPKYQFYGSYAHWTAENTFVDVPNKAENVYGGGEMLSVAQKPDGTHINTFRNPQGWTEAYAWDGKYVWAADWDCLWVYKRLAWEGDWTPEFTSPTIYPQGITWDGHYLWMACAPPGGGAKFSGVYQLKKDGTQITSFLGPSSDLDELTWDGEYLWIGSGASYTIYKVTPGGTVKDKFGIGWSEPEGLTWDGKYLWNQNEINPAYVYQLKTDGTVVDYFPAVAGTGSRNLGIFWDGRYLYESCPPDAVHDSPGFLYQITGSGSFDLNYRVRKV